MGFYTVYSGVVSAAESLLNTVASIKSVKTGRVTRPRSDESPLAIISLADMPMQPGQLGGAYACELSLDVLVLTGQAEPADWLKEVGTPMGDIVDAFDANRNLSGVVIAAIPRVFSPARIPFERTGVWLGGVVGFRILFRSK